MHLQENTLFDLDLGAKVTQNVAQYPLHHVIYAPAKFEVASPKGLGGDAITRNMTDEYLQDGHSEVPNVNFPLQIYVVNPRKLAPQAPFITP